MTTKRPWTINGWVGAGWRIDSIMPDKTGIELLENPVAIVPDKEDAELIVRLINMGVKEDEKSEK